MVNEPPISRLAAAVLAAALAFCSVSTVFATPSPGDGGTGADMIKALKGGHTPRDRALEAYSREIEAGVTDLRRHYMNGGDWPPPPAVAIDYLLLRAAETKRPALTDLALGTVAVYAAMHVNDFVNSGHEVTPGIFEKKAIDEAGMLSMLSVAWRASGKDAFRSAALRIGDDLASWATPSAKGGAGTTQMTMSDSLAGVWIRNLSGRRVLSKTEPGGRQTRLVLGPASREELARIAATLLEAGLIFNRPAWLKAARSIPIRLETGRPGASDKSGNLETARLLLAAIDASAGRPDKSWLKAAPFWAGELAGAPGSPAAKAAAKSWKAPVDPVSGGWAALALMQYGGFAHDDSARALALRIFDGIVPPENSPTKRDPDLFAAQAAAAFAAELYLNPAPMAYIVADGRSNLADSLVMAAVRANRPGRIVSVHSPKETDLLYPADSDGKPIVYVCSGELCAPPSAAPAEVRALVETFALPEATDDFPGVGRPPE